MVDFSISRFQQMATGGAEGAKLRLDSTGEMSTAKRSWAGRLVRFLGGPTKQDRADNQRIMSGLVKQLTAKYGKDVGVKAFLAARPGAQLTEAGQLRANVAKPLTARQIETAIAYAESRTAKHAQQELYSRADRFAPGTDRFADLLGEKNLRPGDLGDTQRDYIASRLRDDVAARAVRDGAPPESGTIKKLASKLIDHALRLGEDGAATANRGYKVADCLVTDVALGLAGPGAVRSDRMAPPSGSEAPGLATLLTELLEVGDGLVADLMRGDDGVPGGDDIQRPVPEAAQRIVAKLSRSEANALLDQALAPDGPARKLALLLELATEDRSVKQDPYRMAATANLARAGNMVLAALAQRAGRPDAAQALDEQVGKAVASMKLPREGVDMGSVAFSPETLRLAGLKNADGLGELLRDVQLAIGHRATAIMDAEQQQQRELDEQMNL